MTDNGFHADNATAGARVAKVFDATDKPEVVEAYVEACKALGRYGSLLANEGVHDEQVAIQVMQVALSVVIGAMRR